PAKILDPHMQGQSDADAPNYDDVIPPEAYAAAANPVVDDEAASATAPTVTPDSGTPRSGGRGGGRRRVLEPLNQDLFYARVRAADFASSSSDPITLKAVEDQRPATPQAAVDA